MDNFFQAGAGVGISLIYDDAKCASKINGAGAGINIVSSYDDSKIAHELRACAPVDNFVKSIYGVSEIVHQMFTLLLSKCYKKLFRNTPEIAKNVRPLC